MSSSFSAPIAALKARLVYQAKAGGIIDGFKLVTQPRTDSDTVDDFPTVRIQGMALDESGQPPRAATSGKIMVALEVAVERQKDDAVARLADALASVIDAIETSVEDVTDGQVEATTLNGAEYKTEPSGVSGDALFSVLVVTLGTKPALRGARRG